MSPPQRQCSARPPPLRKQSQVEDVDGERILHHEPLRVSLDRADAEHVVELRVPVSKLRVGNGRVEMRLSNPTWQLRKVENTKGEGGFGGGREAERRERRALAAKGRIVGQRTAGPRTPSIGL